MCRRCLSAYRSAAAAPNCWELDVGLGTEYVSTKYSPLSLNAYQGLSRSIAVTPAATTAGENSCP